MLKTLNCHGDRKSWLECAAERAMLRTLQGGT
jgi:hypothetical protein